MDDNQIPFKLQEYDKISVYQKPDIKGIIVPLYKRIFLEASDVGQ